MVAPDFYLASTEGYDLEEPRRCWRLQRMANNGRDDLLLVRIEPPLIGQKYGLGERDIDVVLVATRHTGSSLFPIAEWPVFVHVARLLVDVPVLGDKLEKGQYESIAWAEIYRTEDDARIKRM